MAASADPFRCDGCHSGDFADFDHYCDVLDIPIDKAPEAFGCWLKGVYPNWSSNCGPVTPPAPGGK